MHCAKCDRELPDGTTTCSCEPSVPPQAEAGRGLSGFVRAYAPILVITVLILIIILVQPMIPHGFSIVGSFKKGPFQQQIATQTGPRDVEVWLETSLVPPPGFKYRNSQLERLHPRLIPVQWTLDIDGLAEGQQPACLTGVACRVSMCGEDGCDFTVPSSSCTRVSAKKLTCKGSFEWKIRDYYDAVRSDKPVLLQQ